MSIHSLILYKERLSEAFAKQADKDIQVLFGYEPVSSEIIEPFTLFYHLPDDSEYGEIHCSSRDELEEEKYVLESEGFITFHFEPIM